MNIIQTKIPGVVIIEPRIFEDARGYFFESFSQREFDETVCPVTFVKAKVALEELDEGQILQVHLNDGEPVQNVPRSVKDEGHKILKLLDNGDGTYELYVKKVGD